MWTIRGNEESAEIVISEIRPSTEMSDNSKCLSGKHGLQNNSDHIKDHPTLFRGQVTVFLFILNLVSLLILFKNKQQNLKIFLDPKDFSSIDCPLSPLSPRPVF